jgi:hypothetical protein
MPVVDRSIDDLEILESRLTTSSSVEEAWSFYRAKRRLEESLQSMEAEFNRTARGWTWMPPPQVESQGGQQRVSSVVREDLQRSPVTSARRPLSPG